MVAHTFLFEEGLWDVSGETTAAGGERRETVGETRVVHWPGVWLIETRLSGPAGEGAVRETSAEVTPAVEGRDHTTWTAFDSALGKQRGNFVFLGETILAVFDCEHGVRGGEVVRRLDDGAYESAGALFDGDEKIASWTRRLTRRPPA